MAAEFRFRATDAFVYVDTYRREILQPVPRIQSDLARVRERAESTDANLSPTRYFAELRALEHALNFVVKREEPNVVVLGHGDEEANLAEAKAGGAITKSAKQLAQELSRCEEHGETLEIALKQAKGREHELQAQIVSRDQQITRINYRLANSQSTVTVLTATLALVVVVLLLVVLL
jgi:predicted  nucleic acid-binding Zn-ribbon protein